MKSVFLITFRDPKRDGRKGQFGLFIIAAESGEAAREEAAKMYGKKVEEVEFTRQKLLDPGAVEMGAIFGVVYRPGVDDWGPK